MDGLTRRQMLGVLGLGAGLATGRSAVAADVPARRPPNVVFILADDLGYGDLGCYGQQLIHTPNLDRMARDGLRFTQCYSGSTVCAPSRCCLMTGLHTGHARIRGNANVPLEPDDLTVAEVMRAAGYRTALVGKWGLGEPDTTGVPTRKGFDEFFGYLNQTHAHNYYPEYLWRNEQREPLPGNTDNPNRPGVCTQCATYSNDLFTTEALNFLERAKDGPFFLYLAYTVPHTNNEKGRDTGDGMEVPDYGPYDKEPWPNPQKGHAAMITRLDDYVGRVLAKLAELGIDDETAVFFSSDNGTHKEGGADPAFFHSSGPLRGIKRDLYDGGIRVPLIARWPGHIRSGVNESVCAFWDFLPTAADLAGAPPVQAPHDGISIVPALLEGAALPERTLYWEFHERGFTRAVRMGKWKGVVPDAGPMELFDLDNDLSETTNVAADHPDVVAQIEAYLRTARTPSTRWPGK